MGYIHCRDEERHPLEGSVSGAFSGRVTPDPIPNSAVKPICADGSRKARVGQCREHSSSNHHEYSPNKAVFLFGLTIF